MLGLVLVLVGLFLVVDSFWPVLERWVTARQARAVMGQLAEYELAEDGIHYKTPMGSGITQWDALTEIRRDDHVVIAVKDRILGWYAPISALGTEAECAEIIAFMQRRIVDANMAAGRPPPGAKHTQIG
jgi:hypothetical protein